MYSKQQLHNFRRHFFKETNVRPFVRLTKGESEQNFYTIYECSDFLQLDPEVVWEAFTEKKPLKGYTISNISYCDKVAIDYKLNQYIGRNLKGDENRLTARPVRVIDIISNESVCFPSISSAARRLGVTSVNIRHRLSTEYKCSLVAGQYIVLDKDTNTDFITDEIKNELLSRCRRQIVEYDQKEGTLIRYHGLADFARKRGCEENVVHIYYMLKKYQIYLYYPGVYVMFDPKRGGQTKDKEMFKHFRTKINRIRQTF